MGPAPRRERLVHGPISSPAGPSRVSAPTPPAEPSHDANESAAAGCAATTFPVFFLNSSGARRSAAPSPRLSGNTPPHAPRGPRRCLAPPQLPYKEPANCQGPPAPPAAAFPEAPASTAPPPRRGITPRSPGPLALKTSPGSAGASACVCGAAVGLREGSGPKLGVERPPPGVAPAAGLRRDLARRRARSRTCPAGTPRAPPGRPDCQSLSVFTIRCSLRGFAGEPDDGRHKQRYLGPEQPFLWAWVLGFLRLRF